MFFSLQLLLLEGISAGELIFVFLSCSIIFGSKSIPKIARSLGRGMRQLRDASQQIQDDIKSAAFDEDDVTGFQLVKKRIKNKLFVY